MTNNLTWLYENDLWFNLLVKCATMTKIHDGTIDLKVQIEEDLNKWLVSEHKENNAE